MYKILICRLFGQWAASVNEFLQSCVDIVQSIFHPVIPPKISHHENHENEKERDPCEKIYHTLFMSFSKICLLHPRWVNNIYSLSNFYFWDVLLINYLDTFMHFMFQIFSWLTSYKWGNRLKFWKEVNSEVAI